MDLDFFNNLSNTLKENESVQDFIKDLGNFLEQSETSKVLNRRNEVRILEQIKAKKNLSIISENEIRNKRSEILRNYANETRDKGSMYFVVNKSEKEDSYIIFKFENNKKSIIELTENQLPVEAGVNSVLRIKDEEYILDEKATEDIINQITEMANDILDKQNKELSKYRKEGHLYIVQEDVHDRIYLLDLTDKSNYVVEEVDFPKELINQATEGTVFKYINGEYCFYSRNKF